MGPHNGQRMPCPRGTGAHVGGTHVPACSLTEGFGWAIGLLVQTRSSGLLHPLTKQTRLKRTLSDRASVFGHTSPYTKGREAGMNPHCAAVCSGRRLLASPGGAVMKKKKLGVSNTPYNGGWCVTDGGWWVTDGGWWVTNGSWWVADGSWRITAGGNMQTLKKTKKSEAKNSAYAGN